MVTCLSNTEINFYRLPAGLALIQHFWRLKNNVSVVYVNQLKNKNGYNIAIKVKNKEELEKFKESIKTLKFVVSISELFIWKQKQNK